jgi:hypothetical protein
MTLDQLEQEMALARRLESLNVDTNCFTGVTTHEQRREIVRRSIKAHGLESVVFTVKDGRHVLMSQAFERAYQEQL